MTDPHARAWPDYAIAAAAVAGLVRGLRAGLTTDQAVSTGADAGRRVVVDYLRRMVGTGK